MNGIRVLLQPVCTSVLVSASYLYSYRSLGLKRQNITKYINILDFAHAVRLTQITYNEPLDCYKV